VEEVRHAPIDSYRDLTVKHRAPYLRAPELSPHNQGVPKRDISVSQLQHVSCCAGCGRMTQQRNTVGCHCNG
jgi:hypothetical protein